MYMDRAIYSLALGSMHPPFNNIINPFKDYKKIYRSKIWNKTNKKN